MATIARQSAQGRIKCVVWDLDNTIWDGVLSEGDDVAVRQDVIKFIKLMDERGILHSVASKNDEQAALQRLRELELDDLFIYPQIGWGAKSAAIADVAKALNISVEALAFVDDQQFERAEVAYAHPAVLCVDPTELAAAADLPELNPRFITEESRGRRALFRSQIAREESEREFTGTPDEFLAELGMRFRIRRATRDDLQRAEELTVRTNQLNSTGRTYSYEELDQLRASPDHIVLVADLEDVFGTYGTIGLALVERSAPQWHLRLLLMSCRTMSRGVGTMLLNHVMTLARQAGATLRADFVETGRNRVMQVTYAFAGFTEVDRHGTHVVLESDLECIQEPAGYVEIVVESQAHPDHPTRM